MVEGGGIVGAVAGDGNDVAFLLQGVYQAQLVHGLGAGEHAEVIHAVEQLLLGKLAELVAGEYSALGQLTFRQQADFAANLAGGLEVVAGDNLDAHAGFVAGGHSGGHIRAHRVLDDEAAQPGESGAGFLDSLCGIGRAFLVGQPEHAHGFALGGADDGEHFLAGGIGELAGIGCGALGEHHLGGPLQVDDILSDYGRFAAGGHEFVLGMEGQLGDDAELAAGISVGDAFAVQVHEHGALGHVAEYLAFFIEVSGGVGCHGFGEQGEDGGGGSLFVHAGEVGFAHGHEVHGKGAGLIGADDGGGADGFAGIHFAHEVVLLRHFAHAVGQAEGHAHGQAFRHRNHDERDGNHEVGEDFICSGLGHPAGRL